MNENEDMDADKKPRDSSAEWPGCVEHVLIFLVMPFVWIALILLAMIGLWGTTGAASITASIVGTALSVTVLFIAFLAYRSYREVRKMHWDSLLFRPAWRWISIGHVPVLAIVLFFFLRSSEPAKPNFVEQPKKESEAKEFLAKNPPKPYEDNDKTREDRGRLAMQGDAKNPNSNIQVLSFNQSPQPNPTPSGPTEEQPAINMFAYFPPNTSKETRTEKLTLAGASPNPALFLLNGLPIPIALMAQLLGIGGDEIHREATLETVSQTLEGQSLPPGLVAKIIDQLQKHPDRVDAWGTAAKKVIDGADRVDDATKAKAKDQIDALVAKAKQAAAAVAKTASEIVEQIKKLVDGKPTADKKDIDDLIISSNKGPPSPALESVIREQLKEADKKYLEAWETSPAAPPKT